MSQLVALCGWASSVEVARSAIMSAATENGGGASLSRVVHSVCRKGDGDFNEDVVGVAHSCAWVIDGATDVFNSHLLCKENEVGWYVGQLNAALKRYANDTTPLVDVLRSAVDDVARDIVQSVGKPNAPEYQLPTFAVALVRISETTLEYCLLGDCSVYALNERGSTLVRDRRIKPFSAENRQHLKELPPSDAEGRRSLFQATRARANAPDGYPIGSVWGSGVDRSLSGSVALEEGSRVLICSDGIMDYLDVTPGATEAIAYADDLSVELVEIDRFYHSDERFRLDPRPKRIDDQSILVLEA